MQQLRSRRCVVRCLAVGALALGAMTLVANSAQAASGNGPYYATPSWDQKLPCTTTSTCPRFVVLTDWNSEAVLDRNTGLVWEKSPEVGPRTWISAKIECLNRTTGGQMGWRLPSILDLSSLFELSGAPAPSLPPGHPFVSVQSDYWSGTTDSQNPTAAFFVQSSIGLVTTGDKTNHVAQRWCVRGGMSLDQY